MLHLRGEDFHLQEVHGKTESCPILTKVLQTLQFFSKLWMFNEVHVVSGDTVMLQHAATSLSAASTNKRIRGRV